jgi:hypothetical protein
MISIAPVAPLLRMLGTPGPVSSPALSVVDRADGTGATATISAAAFGSSNSLFVQSLAEDWQSANWTAEANISGSGTATLELAVGHYFAYAVSELSGNAAVSNVVFFAVSDGQESIHTRCLISVQARIRSLALPGLNNSRVVVEKLPAMRAATIQAVGLPAIVLAPQRATMPPSSGTNARDDVHYDVLVAMFDRDNQHVASDAALDRHLLWREQIARAFRNQRLGGVPEVIDASVESADGVLEAAWQRDLLASAILLRFTSRERRGF